MIADGHSGLQILDISNPVAPAILGGIDTPSFATAVAVSGNYAYVADGSTGLIAIDVSVPASPVIAGIAPTPGGAFDVKVVGHLAHVAAYFSGLQIVDISDPTLPTLVGGVDTPQECRNVAVDREYVYLADGSAGLQVVDATNPAAPTIVGSVDTPDIAMAVEVMGNHAFIGDGFAGLQIVQAQCSSLDPVTLSTWTALPVDGGILLAWDTAFESHHAGFHVHRSLRPDRDYMVLTLQLVRPPPPYRFFDQEVQEATTYFYRLEAVALNGMSEYFGPVEVRSRSVLNTSPRNWLGLSRPNPLADEDETTIGFELAQRTRARMTLYDASGRLVRVVLNEVLDGGQHVVRWDGRDVRGEGVGAGVYFYKLDAGKFNATRSLVRLK
jgi:hypothetical protein